MFCANVAGLLLADGSQRTAEKRLHLSSPARVSYSRLTVADPSGGTVTVAQLRGMPPASKPCSARTSLPFTSSLSTAPSNAALHRRAGPLRLTKRVLGPGACEISTMLPFIGREAT